MKKSGMMALAAMLLWASGVHAQRDCATGAIGGNRNPSADPEEAQACRLLGRVFCHVAEYRNADTPAPHAVSETAGWLKRMNQTGSHLAQIDYRPMVEGVSQYIYTHAPQPAWTSYYYGIYTCGTDLRTPAGAGKAASMQRWEKAALDCEKKFPGTGDGYVNDPLRACLMQAMKDTVAASK